MPFLTSPFTEVVRGTIIGSYTYPYEFWIEEKRWEYIDKDGKRRVAKGNFENDNQAQIKRTSDSLRCSLSR